MRRDLSGFVAYIEHQPAVMTALINGYENADIALNCGTMLREVSDFPPFNFLHFNVNFPLQL